MYLYAVGRKIELRLNVDAGAMGEVWTELQDETGTPIPGYTLAECTTRPADLLDHRVTWKDKPDLAELVGRPVFIRFYLKNCGLYALRFREKQ